MKLVGFSYFIHCFRTDREIRVEASKMALTAMLKSWPGMSPPPCICFSYLASYSVRYCILLLTPKYNRNVQ